MAMAMVSVVLTSCGGGEDAPAMACAAAPACGGEIQPGRYRIASYCSTYDGPIKLDSCEVPYPVDTSGVVVTGTFTFHADKSYRAELVFGGTVAETHPWQCLTNQHNHPLNCTNLAVAINNGNRAADYPYQAVSCTGASSCTCAYVLADERITPVGSYRTAGNDLVMSGLFRAPVPYCASGNQITIAATFVRAGAEVMSTRRDTWVLIKE